jgi:hypothetical protein
LKTIIAFWLDSCNGKSYVSMTRPLQKMIDTMTATRVDFTSYVDKGGYEIVPDRTPKLRPGQTWLDLKLRDIEPARIVGKGGRKFRRRLDDYPQLFSDFANVKAPEELLAFVVEHGPLTQRITGGWESDIVPELLRQAKMMRTRFDDRASGVSIAIPLTDVKASLEADNSIKYRPATLLDALWLQFAQSLSEGAIMRVCRLKRCRKRFPVGGKSGKRLVAEFCCDEHRIEFNSLKRSRKP